MAGNMGNFGVGLEEVHGIHQDPGGLAQEEVGLATLPGVGGEDGEEEAPEGGGGDEVGETTPPEAVNLGAQGTFRVGLHDLYIIRALLSLVAILWRSCAAVSAPRETSTH